MEHHSSGGQSVRSIKLPGPASEGDAKLAKDGRGERKLLGGGQWKSVFQVVVLEPGRKEWEVRFLPCSFQGLFSERKSPSGHPTSPSPQYHQLPLLNSHVVSPPSPESFSAGTRTINPTSG